MIVVILIAACLSLGLATASANLSAKLAIASFAVTTCLFPRTITAAHYNGPRYVDIAPTAWTLTTYQVALLLVVFFHRPVLRVGRIPAAHVSLIAVLAFQTALTWGGTEWQLSGLWHIAMACLAWPIGMYLGEWVTSCSENAVFATRLALVIVASQLAVAALQLVGFPLPSKLTGMSGEFLSTTNRVTGTLGNPANLSKIAFFLLVAMLPGTLSSSRLIRRNAYLTIAGCLLIATLSISRANVVASAIAVAAWLLLAPRALTLGRRLVILGGGVAVLVLTAGATVDRFLADPEGAGRPELISIALRELPHHWVFGVGLNSYVEVVGHRSALTATGLPVHNLFLLLVIEVGVVCAFLLLLPVISTLVLAAASISKGTVVGRMALAALPGILLIAMTGYGLLSTYLLPIFLAFVGYVQASHRVEADREFRIRHESAPSLSAGG